MTYKARVRTGLTAGSSPRHSGCSIIEEMTRMGGQTITIRDDKLHSGDPYDYRELHYTPGSTKVVTGCGWNKEWLEDIRPIKERKRKEEKECLRKLIL